MSVYRRNGIWQNQLIIDGTRYRKSLGITTGKREAKELEGQWRTEIVMGEAGLGPKKGPTVSQFAVDFLSVIQFSRGDASRPGTVLW
jgi:hypothetical protein